jgi:membrane fusion protein (multidrug efflux system)
MRRELPPGVDPPEGQHGNGPMPGRLELPLLDRAGDCPADRAALPHSLVAHLGEAHDPSASRGQPPGVGVAPQDLRGPVLEAPGPTRLESDPVEQPPDGAGREAQDRRGNRPATKRPGPARARRPLGFVLRRFVATLLPIVALVSGSVLGLAKLGVDLPPPLSTPKISTGLDDMGRRAKQMKESIGGRLESLFRKQPEETHEEPRKVVVTSPKVMDVTVTQRLVCQIHSRQHINVCALDSGYLEEIKIQEGQAVKKGDLMFRLKPVLYETKYKAEDAEARLAELEYQNTYSLFKGKQVPVVSRNEVLLYAARKDRAKAKAELAKAELDFTEVRAPFDGIVDRQYAQLGSLIKEGEVLTTLSDNRVMWVYFNVTEAQYLEFMAGRDPRTTSWKPSPKDDTQIELELANHTIFVDDKKRPQHPALVTVEGQFNNQTGTIPFRADFPNPDGVLRHGQTGTILIHRTLKNALVIPQRATFDLLDKRYVWVVDKNDVVHQRLITTEHELEDIFVIKSGLDESDKIVLEGVRQVEEGGKVEYEFRKPEEVLKNQKFHAE